MQTAIQLACIGMTAVGTGFSSELSLDLVDLLGYRDGVQAAEASSQHAVDCHGDKAVLLGIARNNAIMTSIRQKRGVHVGAAF